MPAACQMARRAAKGIGPFCVWLNEIAGPPESAAELGALACGRSTRNVSAEAVLEAASASTAAEQRDKASHGYCWPATRSLGSSVGLVGRFVRGRLRLHGVLGRIRHGLGIRDRFDGLLLESAVERDEEVVAIRGGIGRDLAVDLLLQHELDQRLAEGLHLEEVAFRDGFGDLVGLVVADQVGDPGVPDHDLDGRNASAADAGEQPLADDAAEDAGEDRPDQRLLDGREELDHPPDRLRGVDRVHRREDEVARLGSGEGGLGGLGVAELADEDHVRVLAEAAPQRLGERRRVEPDFALVDDAAVVAVDDLDRVLDRHDVLPPRAVDVVDHRCERRRLARAGGAGDEDEAAVLLGQAPARRRAARDPRSSGPRAG